MKNPPEVRRRGGGGSLGFRLVVLPNEDERSNQSAPEKHIYRVNGDCKRPTLNGEQVGGVACEEQRPSSAIFALRLMIRFPNRRERTHEDEKVDDERGER